MTGKSFAFFLFFYKCRWSCQRNNDAKKKIKKPEPEPEGEKWKEKTERERERNGGWINFFKMINVTKNEILLKCLFINFYFRTHCQKQYNGSSDSSSGSSGCCFVVIS